MGEKSFHMVNMDKARGTITAEAEAGISINFFLIGATGVYPCVTSLEQKLLT